MGDVNKVDMIGKQEQKIYIDVSTAKLASLGLDRALITSTLAQANAVAAAGTVQTTNEQVRLTVSGEFDSVEGIRAIGIRAGKRTFRLGESPWYGAASSSRPWRACATTATRRSASRSACARAAT